MTDPWDFAAEDEVSHSDLTPLIDVVFMLIIFLVLTASFMKPALEVVLPAVSGDPALPVSSEIRAMLNARGDLFADGASCTPEELRDLLSRYPDRRLNIMADKSAPFQKVAEIMEIAGRERAGRFVITVTGKPAGNPETGSASPASAKVTAGDTPGGGL